MEDSKLEALLEKAATLGAKKALHDVGLHDEDAGRDVADLRSLLGSWRDTKRTIWQKIVGAITTAFLGALALGFYLQMTGKR